MRPRNEAVYEAMLRFFDRVDLRDEGLEHSFLPKEYVWDGEICLPRPARPEADGEHYMAACPFCHRVLLINHRWGVPNPRTGAPDLGPARCADGCLDRPGHRKTLWEMLFPKDPGGRIRMRVYHEPWPTDHEPLREANRLARTPPGFVLPRSCYLVNELPRTDPRAVHLTSQGFDLDELATRWGINACDALPDYGFLPPVPRIVIPVYDRIDRLNRDDDPHLREAVLVGWMAPAIDPVEVGLPQVVSCRFMRKSHCLYGRLRGLAPGGHDWPAEHHWKNFSEGTVTESVRPPRVVVEDPPDLWRLDHWQTAVFGAEISDRQEQILCEECAPAPIVVFFNRGSGEAAAQAGRRLQAKRPEVPHGHAPNHLVAIAELPAGRDAVRQCTAEEVWGQVHAAVLRWFEQREIGRRHRSGSASRGR
jgi:hypothetical protein